MPIVAQIWGFNMFMCLDKKIWILCVCVYYISVDFKAYHPAHELYTIPE